MKSFNYKVLAAAAATACAASGASAGSVTAPAAPIKFALEAVTNTTPVTIPVLTYTMGVGRAANQNFTFIVKVPSGSTTAFSGTCPNGANVTTSNPNITLAVKRQSASECAYDVTVANVANSVNVGDTISLANLTVNNHALGSGTNLSVVVNLADPGETARIDNSADISATVATSTQIVSLYAGADTHTTADVNFNSGNSPLFGFVAGAAVGQTSTVNDDTLTTYANFSVNVAAGYVIANGTTAANAANTVTNVTLTVTGDYSGLVTNFANGTGSGASAVVVAGNGGTITPTVTFTPNNASSTAAFTLTGAQLIATGATPVRVQLATAQTQSLGTQRVYQVSGSANPTVNAAESIGNNASWWTWKANAIQLATAFFNNDNTNGNLTRFFFQNLGTSAKYTATCYTESGVTPTYGVAQTGTLTGAGTTAINASDVCTFSTGKRGSIVFTINSAAGKVKGVYQQAINGAAAGYIALERPYANRDRKSVV